MQKLVPIGVPKNVSRRLSPLALKWCPRAKILQSVGTELPGCKSEGMEVHSQNFILVSPPPLSENMNMLWKETEWFVQGYLASYCGRVKKILSTIWFKRAEQKSQASKKSLLPSGRNWLWHFSPARSTVGSSRLPPQHALNGLIPAKDSTIAAENTGRNPKSTPVMWWEW